MAKYNDGDDTGFGFAIPSDWPRWKKKCGAMRKRAQKPCERYAVRGMARCRFHGGGGERNAKIGLIRYLAWIITDCPRDTPAKYAQYVSIAAALEQLFNNGKGTDSQKMRAAQWLLGLDMPPPLWEGKKEKKDKPSSVQEMVTGEEVTGDSA